MRTSAREVQFTASSSNMAAMIPGLSRRRAKDRDQTARDWSRFERAENVRYGSGRDAKDHEVRSTDVLSPMGDRFQIWLDAPSDDGTVIIHAWDYGDRRSSFRATHADFRTQLEQALLQVRNWF